MKLNFPWRKIQLVNAANEFAALRLWDEYDNMDLFVVETPIEGPVVASIMGAGRQEFGLCVFRGPDAFRQPFLLSQGAAALSKKGDTIGFSMDYYRDMHPEQRKWFKMCNYRANKGDWLPSFIVVRRGNASDLEQNGDIQLLLYVLKGIISAQKDGLLNPKNTGKKKTAMHTLVTSGSAENPTVRIMEKSFDGSRELLEYCNKDEFFEPLDMPDLSQLPKLDQTWVLVTEHVEVREIPDACMIAIAEENSGYILHTDIIGMDTAEVMEMLAAACGGDNASENLGVPKEIIFADQSLFDLLKDSISSMGIKTTCSVKHPAAVQIRKSLKRDLPRLLNPNPVRHKEVGSVDLSIVPNADDLKGWKAVAAAQTNRFIDFWNTTDALRKSRPSNQFFGDSDWDYYLEEYRNMLVLPSYVTWSALCYRARKKDAAYIEKLLAGNLPKALRLYLENLNAAYPSLYQITETDSKSGVIGLKDLLLGRTVSVHDQGFSTTVKPGCIVPLWVTAAGSFHFTDIAGPVFGPTEALHVIEELQALKLPAQPTTLWLRQNAHIFGRLWNYYDQIQEQRRRGPELRNTSGDPLEFITAQFGYSDPQAVRLALKRQTDIDYVEAEDTFFWIEESDPGPKMGPTLLGRIYFEDGFVKAEVNSKKRLDRLRQRLEGLGLVYRQHERKTASEIQKQAKGSAKRVQKPCKQEDLPEEIVSAVRQQMTTFYRDWLDQPIPALDYKTPRQAAKNAKGAQKVRIMIEAWPEPIGNCQAGLPKKEMLRELGLEETR